MTGRSIMWLIAGAACFFLLMATFIPHEARSQQPQMMQIKCAEASKQEQHLRENFKEEPVWIGSNSNGMPSFWYSRRMAKPGLGSCAKETLPAL